MGVLEGEKPYYESDSDSEYFDAIENDEDSQEQDTQCPPNTKVGTPTNNNVAVMLLQPSFDDVKSRITNSHPRFIEIRRVAECHVSMAEIGVDDSTGGWDVIAKDGHMTVYSKELEVDGFVVDPLKAVHTVSGITGHEMCHYFYNLQYRKDWDHTVEKSKLVERIADDTTIQHQVHKRLWPAAARDAVFWSHITHGAVGGRNVWSVSNYSTQHPEAPKTKCVRVDMNVCLVCETVVEDSTSSGPSRKDVTCKITYSASVHPGGWAPPSLLRQVYKREYPKFLKRFTKYVTEMTKDKPLMF